MFNNGTKLVAIIKNGNSLKLTKVIILVATQAVIPLWLLLVSTQVAQPFMTPKINHLSCEVLITLKSGIKAMRKLLFLLFQKLEPIVFVSLWEMGNNTAKLH